MTSLPSGLDALVTQAQQLVDSKGSYNPGQVSNELMAEYARFYLFIKEVSELKPRHEKERPVRIVNAEQLTIKESHD